MKAVAATVFFGEGVDDDDDVEENDGDFGIKRDGTAPTAGGDVDEDERGESEGDDEGRRE